MRAQIGTLAIVEPENQWWREFNLGSPEAILKVFVQQSGCFALVNRGRSMQSRAMERAMAEQGELQAGSNSAAARSRRPIISSSPTSSRPTRIGRRRIGAAAGALGGLFGGAGRFVDAIAGGINVKKGEANVTLSVVNARTTEEKLSSTAIPASATLAGAPAVAPAGGAVSTGRRHGYQNTEIGQVIVLDSTPTRSWSPSLADSRRLRRCRRADRPTKWYFAGKPGSEISA